MTIWCVGTVGHFLLTARWLKRAGSALTRDELWFQTMVIGTGTLSIALHGISSTTGLTVARVLLVLLAGHAIAAWYVGRPFGLRARLQPTAEASAKTVRGAELPRPAADTDLVTRILETAAIVAMTAIVIQWTLLAMSTADVSGSDAVHYHVPNAVNLALGGSLFDLPPTSHLYPMGSSTLAAWFILPLQTTLLTDLGMVLPFLLLVSGAGWLFRQLTSLSGWAWSTWMMLALLGTPLFRSASLMSADLLFAAASMAFAAALLSPLIRQKLNSADVWLIALSLGLLLGSKVTGIVVAGLLGLPAALALGVLKLRGKWTTSVPAWVWAGAASLAVGAGGIWLVRNWWVWGSPVAPNGLTVFGFSLFPGVAYEATTYLSVLGDIKDKPDYQLWERARHFTDVWLSSWYLPALGSLVLIPFDLIVSRRRGVSSSVRLWAMVVACGTGAVMAWFLSGAPWTSLEWTGGSSLRYGLPWLTILPVVAWVGLFPASLPWYRDKVPAAIGGLVISVGGLAVFGGHQELPFPPLPTSGVFLAAVAIVGARYALQLVSPRWRWVLAVGVALCATVLLDIRTTQADMLAQETKAAAIANGPRTNAERIYDAAIAFETKDARSCDVEGRRFFVTNRFDEAGALQGARLTNRVFYAARDLRVTTGVRPAMGPCDYLITERAVMDTTKGAALHAGLNTSGTLVEVATIGDVVLLVHR